MQDSIDHRLAVKLAYQAADLEGEFADCLEVTHPDQHSAVEGHWLGETRHPTLG